MVKINVYFFLYQLLLFPLHVSFRLKVHIWLLANNGDNTFIILERLWKFQSFSDTIHFWG